MLKLPDYSVTGHGDVTIFLLHGAFGSKEYWTSQTIALSKAGYRVVAWDAPGYGISPLPDNFSIRAASEILGILIDAVGGNTNVLLGHSMGGMIAQRTFGLRPGAVDGLILSATSAAFGRNDGDWQRQFVSKRLRPLDEGLEISEFAPQMLRAMMAPGANGEEVELVINVVSRMRAETFRCAINAIVDFDARDLLSSMKKIPIACIAGEHDLAAAPKVMEKLASLIEAEYIFMPHVGHFAWAEDPIKFNENVLNFLQHHFREN